MTTPDHPPSPGSMSPGPMLFELTPPPAAVAAAAVPPVPAAEPPPMEMDLAEVTAAIPEPEQDTFAPPPAVAVGRSADGPADGHASSLPMSPATTQTAGANWPARLFIGGVAVAVLAGVGFDAADLLSRAFAVSRGLGWGVAAALTGAGLGLLIMLGREWRGLVRLRRFDRLRATADDLSRQGDGFGGAGRVAAAVMALYVDRPEMAAALERLHLYLPDAHDDGQVLRLLEQEALAPLDAAAYRAVAAAARDTALATTLVPVALLDMAIVLWRNLKLVRRIASLYGVQPGYWATLKLLRRLLGNLAVAGAGEGLHHAAADALGGSLMASVSASLGKGLLNGLLTARVGLTAMHFCRPLAFSPAHRPGLAGIRGALLGLGKELS